MPNPVVHFEIGCRDSGATQQFFRDLFQWKMEAAGPAAMISTGSDEGIAGHISSLGHEPHNYVTIYVQVDNLQAYLDKAESLGGKTVYSARRGAGHGAFRLVCRPRWQHNRPVEAPWVGNGVGIIHLSPCAAGSDPYHMTRG